MMEAKTQAYVKMRNNIPEKMEEVLRAIRAVEPCTYADVADYLHAPLNTVTNRISELVRTGLIYTIGTRECGGYTRSLFVSSSPEAAAALQRKLVAGFVAEKMELENDLRNSNLSPTAKNMLKVRLTALYTQLRRLTRYKVME